jgi:voltage-gated potassium channel
MANITALLNRVINPESHWKLRWDGVVLGTAVLATVLAPLNIAFDLGSSVFLLFIDILITLIFLADIWILFHTAYMEKRVLITDLSLIRKRYIRGWFGIDLLAALPFFLFTGSSFLVINRILRFARITRILKLLSGTRVINRLKKTKINPNVMRLALMIFWLLMAAHIIAVGMVMVGGVPDDLPDPMRYLQAFYWTVTTLATVGYGDITPDKTNSLQLIFTIITQFVGVGMYGFIIGNISTVIANIDIAKTQYREKMERINTFLKYRNIPHDLTKRINDYYDYLWESRRGYDESSVVDELPFSLKIQVSQELHREIITKVPLFKGANPSFIRDTILSLRPVVYTPGDYIVRKGELGEEMYFISRGAVDVVSEDESVVYATLREGAFFGEIALLLSSPRNATIKARDYCDLYSLDKTTFEKILEKYPEFAREVAKLAEERKKETEAAAKKTKGT